MTLQKITAPLILLMFTALCALPIVGAIPLAIAQEDDDASLVAVPITDLDERAANLAQNDAQNDALDTTVVQEETRIIPTTPPEEGEQAPEFVTFCLVQDLFCFDTMQECLNAADVLNRDPADCKGFEAFPQDSRHCTVESSSSGQEFVKCEA